PDSDLRRAISSTFDYQRTTSSLIPTEVVEPTSHRVGDRAVHPSGELESDSQISRKHRLAFVEHRGVRRIEQKRADVSSVIRDEIEQHIELSRCSCPVVTVGRRGESFTDADDF